MFVILSTILTGYVESAGRGFRNLRSVTFPCEITCIDIPFGKGYSNPSQGGSVPRWPIRECSLALHKLRRIVQKLDPCNNAKRKSTGQKANTGELKRRKPPR